MPCTGTFAAAWQFTTFWCISSLLLGEDNGGGVANPQLTDTFVDFMDFGVEANVGMRLWNLTQDTEGFITVVTDTTLTAPGVTWADGDEYRVVLMTRAEESAAENALSIAATDIHSAIAAANACDCTMASWAYLPDSNGYSYLAKLNIIDAAIYHQCACARTPLSDEMRQRFLDWVDAELELIRTGEKELCEGETGSAFPAITWIEQAWTEFNAREIIYRDMLRRGG